MGWLLATGLAAALTLSACGGETTTDTAADTAVATNEETTEAAAFPVANGGSLNLFNWTDYLSPDVLKRFESETGISVNL